MVDFDRSLKTMKTILLRTDMFLVEGYGGAFWWKRYSDGAMSRLFRTIDTALEFDIHNWYDAEGYLIKGTTK